MIISRAAQNTTGRFVVIGVSLMATLAVLVSPALAGEFGLRKVAMSARNENGSADVQAGSHPYALNTTFMLNIEQGAEETPIPEGGELKDVKVELPPGFVGDPNATPKCADQEFMKSAELSPTPGCSNETVVGVSTTLASSAGVGAGTDLSDPVYNLVPPAGVAAVFGFLVAHRVPVLLETSVRTGSDYGLTTTVLNVDQALAILGSKVTIWGVPGASAHNPVRGTCLKQGNNLLEHGLEGPDESGFADGEDELEGPIGPAYSGFPLESVGNCPTAAPELPLLTNPTSCGMPRVGAVSVDSWQKQGDYVSKAVSLPELVGCEKLNFAPTIGVVPDGGAASTPTGLNVGIHVPQEPTEDPVGLAEADVRDTTVTLPPGVQLSPAAADGLQGCSLEQVGFTGYKELEPGTERGVQTAQFKEKVYNPATGEEEATVCPNASKVANVKIKTPLLEEELEGSVYLAAPQNFSTLTGALEENPFESLVALYLVAADPARGVLIKLPGKVVPNEQTGQIVTTFENTPQLPFSDLKLEFYGTDRAPLATPALCGAYTTQASFTSWGNEPRSPSTEFAIDSGPNGSACTYPGQALPFSPSLSSGVTNISAGSFSDLTTTLSREDGQQSIQSVQVRYPAGVSGILAGVKLCPEAQANAGTCGPESEIGETIVSVGLGNDPFSVTGGKVYLTERYDGAPFGLSIVNPAKAGPFDLQEGRPVVVRAKVEVDPVTAALTVTTDPSGAHAIPTIIDGIPLQIKHVNVNITRAGFTFDPTSCSKTAVTGSIGAAEGATSNVSIPFQVTNCATLKFQPTIAVATAGKASKANGASLNFKISYPKGAMGSQSWFSEARFDLPKQLPARLTTLQKACVARVFEANPAGCPSASLIGHAIVHTQVLPVPLEGPVYFVSYGGAKFPDAVMVLQGYGVTVDLTGETFIAKDGVTSATFKNTPDVPFESIEVSVPTGPYSEFGANLPAKDGYSFCGQNLKMPTLFVAQNGLEINQETPITVTGCTKPKALTRAQKLTTALKACRKDKHKSKRATCERTARKKYGTATKATKRRR
jgi:hypothetical protein